MNKFNILIIISDPLTNNKKQLELVATFSKSNSHYGNGYYLALHKNGELFKLLDLRYDTNFSINKPFQFLTNLCAGYWNGENGSFKLEKIAIEKAD